MTALLLRKIGVVEVVKSDRVIQTSLVYFAIKTKQYSNPTASTVIVGASVPRSIRFPCRIIIHSHQRRSIGLLLCEIMSNDDSWTTITPKDSRPRKQVSGNVRKDPSSRKKKLPKSPLHQRGTKKPKKPNKQPPAVLQRPKPLEETGPFSQSDFPSLGEPSRPVYQPAPSWGKRPAAKPSDKKHLLLKRGSKRDSRDYHSELQPAAKEFTPASMRKENDEFPSLAEAAFPSLSASAFPSLKPNPTSKPKPKMAPIAPSPKKLRKEPKSPPKKKDKKPGAAAQAYQDIRRKAILQYKTGELILPDTITKGRQRVRPRKKKFSSLKKKVLEERLRRYKATLEETEPASVSTTVCVTGFVESEEELEDDDEYEEMCNNLVELAQKIGAVRWASIPKKAPDPFPAFVDFCTADLSKAASECWNGLTLGGCKLSSRIIGDNVPSVESEWQAWCLQSYQAVLEASPGDEIRAVDIVVVDILTEDDFEDADCMEESLTDIRSMAEKLGKLSGVKPEGIDNSKSVVLTYECTPSEAAQIAKACSDMIIGGKPVVAMAANDNNEQEGSDCCVLLENLLTEDDVEDQDCLEESLIDVRELASVVGGVVDISCTTEDRIVRVTYATREDGLEAVTHFMGMNIGGLTIAAKMLVGDTLEKKAEQPPEPIFSGDKLVSERFAECKRAPKVPNSGKPRSYASFASDERVKPLLAEMLSELMRLQKRAHVENNTKAKRRLVMGLREVARGIRSRKVRMIVMANNLDDYGALDAKLIEILQLAKQEGVPVFFEYTKRTLGKAIGKSIKIAVIGIQNCDGANQQFKKLQVLAPVLSIDHLETVSQD